MDILLSVGQLLVVGGIGYAAWRLLVYVAKYGDPLQWKSADFPIPTLPASGQARFGTSTSLSVSAQDVRVIEEIGRHGPHGHFLSGNGVIDTQHQRLSDYANNLRQMILSGRPLAEVNAIIDDFVRDMVQHFRDEEAILAAALYPGTAKHAAEHRELVSGLAMLVRQFRAGALSIGELFRFLAHDVLTNHMAGTDRELHAYSPTA